MPRYPIKSFKGLLVDDSQDQIYLAGGDSTKGYRIVKFEILPATPGDVSMEHCTKIYKTKQTSIDDNINFSDDSLLGAAVYAGGSSTSYPQIQTAVVFDNEVFNQDIYVTQKDTQNGAINYYIELEEVTMSDAEAANVNFVAALTHT